MVQKTQNQKTQTHQILLRTELLATLALFIAAVALLLATSLAHASAGQVPRSYPKPSVRKPAASKISDQRKVAKKPAAKISSKPKARVPTASELAIKKIESESAVLWDTSYSRPQIVDAPVYRKPAAVAPVERTVSIDFSQTQVEASSREPSSEAAKVAAPAKQLKTETQAVVYIEK